MKYLLTGIARTGRGADHLVSSGVDQVNFLKITGLVVALPSEGILSVVY